MRAACILHLVVLDAHDCSGSQLIREFSPYRFARNFYMFVIYIYVSYGAYWLLQLGGQPEPTHTLEPKIKAQQDQESGWKFMAYFAGFFSLLSFAILKIVSNGIAKQDWATLAFLMFPAATVGLWWVALGVRSGRIKVKGNDPDPIKHEENSR